MSSCVLDEETFCRCCQLFLEHSHSLCDGWSWQLVKGSEEGYLRKVALGNVRIRTSSNPNQITDQYIQGASSDQRQGRTSPFTPHKENDDDHNDEQYYDDDDGAVCCMQDSRSSGVIQYEYHILYSYSYQTPVLYFRASTLEGRSLSLEEVWDGVHPNYRQRLQHGPWDTITQQEHPLLGQSFFVLHPCRTEEFMRPVLQAALEEHRQVNYVVTWLSVVGPVVGLDVPLSYCTKVPAPSHTSPSPLQPPALQTQPD
ncbi:ubiquitin-like-conjugating enzyme ATG10 isoform X2 [Esox lucius]|nr:ubiquitin-like-conjugating enzyme ATG10 isoform X2 [Esox lucius]XP_010876469.2 ubiquitin-like-conjugating enzyme ATG10 isoform X2 [Esox lucius]XP_010876470.2 ubiquitin-like-conjugating enzyme ATG10 isoform X2 [Esox lucius]